MYQGLVPRLSYLTLVNFYLGKSSNANTTLVRPGNWKAQHVTVYSEEAFSFYF